MPGTREVVPTPVGPARVELEGRRDGPLLVLGHGAGGGPDAPDLLAAGDAALSAGWAVARVEQPYRVLGRRGAEAPPRLDMAWLAVLAALPTAPLLVVGGRSSGARVACRTAGTLGPHAVLCLAFPLRPPGRDTDRADELSLPAMPRLVVQGARDPFGVPAAGPGVAVHVVPGADHAFATRRKDGRTADQVCQEIQETVGAWLVRLQTVT